MRLFNVYVSIENRLFDYCQYDVDFFSILTNKLRKNKAKKNTLQFCIADRRLYVTVSVNGVS